jgi:hypothetical protein
MSENRPSDGQRVIRGGSWNNKPENLRSLNRNRNNADYKNHNVGFGLAQSARPASCRARSRSIHGSSGRGKRVSMSSFPGLPVLESQIESLGCGATGLVGKAEAPGRLLSRRPKFC